MHRTGHILLLHHSESQRMTRVADWFGAGMAAEDKLFYVDVAGWGVEALAADLSARGFAVERALEDKHLEFVGLEDLLQVGTSDGLIGRALHDGEHAGVRLAVRGDAFASSVSAEEYLAVEQRLADLCHVRRVSALCQFDARTTQDDALAQTLELHPDWVFEGDLNLRRRGHVILVEGVLDTLDGEVLVRALDRMTRGLSIEEPLALDLRAIDALTAGAGEAVIAGTRRFRDRGGRVRCGSPPGEGGWLLRSLVEGHEERLQLVH
jgi:hypothetical protein